METLNKLSYKFWTGFSLGLFMPFVGFCCYYFMLFFHITFSRYVHMALVVEQLQAPLISLSLIINLGVFFLFIKTDRENAAKGVLYGTFLYAPLVVYLKYF